MIKKKKKNNKEKKTRSPVRAEIAFATIILDFMIELRENQWNSKSFREGGREGSLRDAMERDEGGGTGIWVCMHFQGGLSVARKKKKTVV